MWAYKGLPETPEEIQDLKLRALEYRVNFEKLGVSVKELCRMPDEEICYWEGQRLFRGSNAIKALKILTRCDL